MNEEWWERPTCFVCNYWWALLLLVVLALAAFFTRDLWLPLLGLGGEPAAQGVVTPEGGELALGRAQVLFPENSVNSETDVRIARLPRSEAEPLLPEGAELISPLYEVELAEPVLVGEAGIVIPYEPGSFDPAADQVYIAAYSDGFWTRLPSQVDQEIQVVSAATTHFSVVGIFKDVLGMQAEILNIRPYPDPYTDNYVIEEIANIKMTEDILLTVVVDDPHQRVQEMRVEAYIKTLDTQFSSILFGDNAFETITESTRSSSGQATYQVKLLVSDRELATQPTEIRFDIKLVTDGFMGVEERYTLLISSDTLYYEPVSPANGKVVGRQVLFTWERMDRSEHSYEVRICDNPGLKERFLLGGCQIEKFYDYPATVTKELKTGKYWWGIVVKGDGGDIYKSTANFFEVSDDPDDHEKLLEGTIINPPVDEGGPVVVIDEEGAIPVPSSEAGSSEDEESSGDADSGSGDDSDSGQDSASDSGSGTPGDDSTPGTDTAPDTPGGSDGATPAPQPTDSSSAPVRIIPEDFYLVRTELITWSDMSGVRYSCRVQTRYELVDMVDERTARVLATKTIEALSGDCSNAADTTPNETNVDIYTAVADNPSFEQAFRGAQYSGSEETSIAWGDSVLPVRATGMEEIAAADPGEWRYNITFINDPFTGLNLTRPYVGHYFEDGQQDEYDCVYARGIALETNAPIGGAAGPHQQTWEPGANPCQRELPERVIPEDYFATRTEVAELWNGGEKLYRCEVDYIFNIQDMWDFPNVRITIDRQVRTIAGDCSGFEVDRRFSFVDIFTGKAFHDHSIMLFRGVDHQGSEPDQLAWSGLTVLQVFREYTQHGEQIDGWLFEDEWLNDQVTGIAVHRKENGTFYRGGAPDPDLCYWSTTTRYQTNAMIGNVEGPHDVSFPEGRPGCPKAVDPSTPGSLVFVHPSSGSENFHPQPVQVQLVRASDGEVVAETTSDNKGNFQFTNIPAGEYKISEVWVGSCLIEYNVPASTETKKAGWIVEPGKTTEIYPIMCSY